MNGKLWSAVVTATVLGSLLSILAFKIGTDQQTVCLNLTVLAVGTVFGWLLGILLSPYDTEEQKQFSIYAKAATVFISGYAVAKVDKLAEHVITPEFFTDPVSAFRVLSFVACMGLAMIVTSIFRRYA